MTAPRLNPKQLTEIDEEVNEIFDLLLTRLLGGSFTGKRLFVGYLHDFTLPGLFQTAVSEEGGRVDIDLVSDIVSVAQSYLNKYREEAKAATKRKIQGLLNDIDAGRLKPENWHTAIEGELAELWNTVKNNVKTVVSAETMAAHTMGAKEGIDQVNDNLGIEDPVLCWIHPLDKYTCKECYRLYYLLDMTTPRVWKESEVVSTYHKRGDPNPSWFLTHPNCRGALSTVLPGFGFDAQGRITYIAEGHKEWDYQRGFKSSPTPGVDARRKKLGKSEVDLGSVLSKSDVGGVWWHGTPSGDLRGGTTGLHVGTKRAAEEALTARIGYPVEGTWDGQREYGKTLLAGQNTLKGRGIFLTGYNASAPQEDHYSTGATFSDGSPVLPSHRPDLFPVRIVGPMSNTVASPHPDFRANGMMAGQLKRGTAKRGYYYKNAGEDVGSVSATLPATTHVERVSLKNES